MGQKITPCLWFNMNAEEAIAFYAGIFDAMEPSHRAMFRWLSMVLTVLSLVVCLISAALQKPA